MTVARRIEQALSGSSWIRKMFEEGARLKTVHGDDKVFDFSLGNPNMHPPERFRTVMQRLAAEPDNGQHGYMPNAGFAHVRQAVADYLSSEQMPGIKAEDVIMTCGAAGGLNVIMKALLDPGDVVISPAPCFVEYKTYTENHGGLFKTVPSRGDFTLDLEALEDAIDADTKIVLINSPHNPTGQVYDEASLQRLGELLEAKSRELDRVVYLVSDEPYRKIVFDGVTVPSIFRFYRDSLITTSYSKDISIPGERIGFTALHPQATHRDLLLPGLTLALRTLGFVNAPAMMQLAVAELQGESVDIGAYQRKRDLLCDGLADAGYSFVRPPGAFYLFPRSPVADDVRFVQFLQEELILAVPGSGFNGPGHFRLAFCVSDDTITNAMPGFTRAIEKARAS